MPNISFNKLPGPAKASSKTLRTPLTTPLAPPMASTLVELSLYSVRVYPSRTSRRTVNNLVSSFTGFTAYGTRWRLWSSDGDGGKIESKDGFDEHCGAREAGQRGCTKECGNAGKAKKRMSEKGGTTHYFIL